MSAAPLDRGRSRTPKSPLSDGQREREGDRYDSRSKKRDASPSPPGSYMSISGSRDGSRSRDGRKDKKDEGFRVVVVSNLTKNVHKQHLEEIFGAYGKVTGVDLPLMRETNQNRGKAALEFSTASSAQSAIDHMNGGHLDGMAIGVEISEHPLPSPGPVGPPAGVGSWEDRRRMGGGGGGGGGGDVRDRYDRGGGGRGGYDRGGRGYGRSRSRSPPSYNDRRGGDYGGYGSRAPYVASGARASGGGGGSKQGISSKYQDERARGGYRSRGGNNHYSRSPSRSRSRSGSRSRGGNRDRDRDYRRSSNTNYRDRDPHSRRRRSPSRSSSRSRSRSISRSRSPIRNRRGGTIPSGPKGKAISTTDAPAPTTTKKHSRSRSYDSRSRSRSGRSDSRSLSRSPSRSRAKPRKRSSSRSRSRSRSYDSYSSRSRTRSPIKKSRPDEKDKEKEKERK